MLCHHGFLSICTCTCMSTMDVFIKVILFSYVLYTMFTTIQSAEQTFFKESLTWIEAHRCCASKMGQLATVDVDSKIVTCNNIPKGINNLKIWTGNIRRYSEWIEFQGCYSLNGTMGYGGNVSECYQLCHDKLQNAFQHFAFKDPICICQPTNTAKGDAVNSLCKATAVTDIHYMWLYKVLYNKYYEGHGECVASKCINGSQKEVAVNCGLLQRPLCEVHSRSTRSKELNWSESQRNCKDPGFKEINASGMCGPNRNTTDAGMWTNIFRVLILDRADRAERIKITEVSSCVIYECLNKGQTIGKFHTSCNETAGGFFCKSEMKTNPVQMTHTTVPVSVSKAQDNYIPNKTTHYSFASTDSTSTKLSVSIRSADITTTLKPPARSSTMPTTTDQQVPYTTDASTIGIVCGVTIGGVVMIAAIIIITCKFRNVGPFRKRPHKEDTIEMNNSINCAIPVYHDTVLNSGNGSVPKDGIRNNTAENTSNAEIQKKTYFSNHEYAVVVKKHTAQPRGLDLEDDDNQSQRFETEDEYDILKHTVDKGEEQIEINVYDSSLGVCAGDDPTYNSIKIGQVNNDTTYDHTSNIVQKQVNMDTT